MNMRLIALAAALATMGLQQAMAADYEPDLYPANDVIDAPIEEYKPVEIGSGWYIRGDISYSVVSKGSATGYRTYAGGIYGTDTFDTGRIKSMLSYGVGFGYTFNRWLRADATLERFGGSFNGTTSDPNPCTGIVTAPGNDTTCASTDTASFVAYGAMANAYVDLGTFAGFTPYVGAGIGLAWLNWGNLNDTTYCVDSATDTCPAASTTTTTHGGRRSARLVYSFMAGAAYDISKNLKLDVSYRYRKIARGNFFSFDAASIAAGASGVQAQDNGLTNHEVKVGLRYEIW